MALKKINLWYLFNDTNLKVDYNKYNTFYIGIEKVCHIVYKNMFHIVMPNESAQTFCN